jgi:hypothetical protein
MISFEQVVAAVCRVTGRNPQTTKNNMSTWIDIHGVKGTDYERTKERGRKVYVVTPSLMANWTNVSYMDHRHKISVHTELASILPTTLEDERIRILNRLGMAIPPDLAAKVTQRKQEKKLEAPITQAVANEEPVRRIEVTFNHNHTFNFNHTFSGSVEGGQIGQELKTELVERFMREIAPALVDKTQITAQHNILELLGDSDSEFSIAARRNLLSLRGGA